MSAMRKVRAGIKILGQCHSQWHRKQDTPR